MAEKRTIRGKALRVTKTDGCGEPVLGPESVVQTKGFITITLTPNNNAGTPIQVDNANGERFIDDTPTPKLSNFTVEYAFIGVNPSLLHLLTGMPLVYNAAGTGIVGFGADDDVDVELLGFASELWTGVAFDACEDGEVEYGYGLLPFVKGGALSAVTVANDAVNFNVSGAVTRKGNQWGAGPYDVVDDGTGVAGPLNEAIPTTRHFHWEVTSIAPPSDLDGDIMALGSEDLAVTAGTPGLPAANSYFPEGMEGVVATPLTAWTTGQYAVDWLGDEYHWDSDSWEPGRA